MSQRSVGVGAIKTRPRLAVTHSHARSASAREGQLRLLYLLLTCFAGSQRSTMDIYTACRVLCLVLVAGTHLSRGIDAEKNPCTYREFYNKDLDVCVPCSTCKQYPKTPSCDTCPTNEPQDSWRVAAITSFSVLAAVVVFGALLIGVLVHQCRSRRTLREPIEETTGPLYPV